jgi:ElaB/YqjD/DUF883 family membrane-anchored ribosome-binding protein
MTDSEVTQQAGTESVDAAVGDPAATTDVNAQARARAEERTAGLRARKEKLRKRQEELKAKVADARGRASEATPEDAKRTAAQVAQTASERPLPAIAIAFGTGLLLGRLTARR